MPDWTYRTIFRPALLRLRPETARAIALGSMGLLSRAPLGRRVIQWMGHMQPDPRLAVERNGFKSRSRVGLGCRFDARLSAISALAEFGFGFLEIGPIVVRPPAKFGEIQWDAASEVVRFEPPGEAIAPRAAKERLVRAAPLGLPVFARIEPSSVEEARQTIDELSACVAGFIVSIERLDDVCRALAAANDSVCIRPILFLAIDAQTWQIETDRNRCIRAIADGQIAGIVVVEAAASGIAQQIGRQGFAAALECVQHIRTEIGPQPIVIGSAGVHAPADALDYIEAGADLVQVDSGLVFAGPGLPKRINEALLYRGQMTQFDAPSKPTRPGREAWFWALLMGCSMLAGGLLAMLIATTRVVMPYDESMAGLSRQQLSEVNDRLLSFMTHDRVTLAGTMLAVGILYTALAWRGIRRGLHWAYLSVVLSAFAGFLSFFSFLGFGYFDPFHAFVTAILFQFLALTIHSDLPARQPTEAPGLWNDGAWRASQWGQLLFVIHGAVLIVAGVVISWIGMSSVFVPEDLEFMQTCAASLVGAHPQLIPLVAHDRATFGGMLISCGAATLLPAMWGFQRGQAWLWGALMLAGNLAYCSAIGVHWFVGYHSLKHLLPAYGGLALLWASGVASYGHLAARDPSLEAEWKRRLERV
ncbi:MAG TPA: hypothetical protein VGN42_08895 [Pirellulales bacterium]|nr:hypothetical protein [Pirellulales bacterium]